MIQATQLFVLVAFFLSAIKVCAAARLTNSPPVNGQAIISWNSRGTLETATQISGPGITITNAANPYTNPITTDAQFFRLNQTVDVTGRADQAAEWTQKLAQFEQAETEKQPATPPRQTRLAAGPQPKLFGVRQLVGALAWLDLSCRSGLQAHEGIAGGNRGQAQEQWQVIPTPFIRNFEMPELTT